MRQDRTPNNAMKQDSEDRVVLIAGVGDGVQPRMTATFIIKVTLLLVCIAVCGCQYGQSTRFSAQSVFKPWTPPGESVVSAIRSLPPTAKLDDVLKITGKPSVVFKIAFQDYYFTFDDCSGLKVRADPDGKIISIELQRYGKFTELWHKP